MSVLSLIPFYLLEMEKLLDRPGQKTLICFSLCFPRTILVLLKTIPVLLGSLLGIFMGLKWSLEACKNMLLELCKHGLRWLLCKVLDTSYECFYLWASPSAFSMSCLCLACTAMRISNWWGLLADRLVVQGPWRSWSCIACWKKCDFTPLQAWIKHTWGFVQLSSIGIKLC